MSQKELLTENSWKVPRIFVDSLTGCAGIGSAGFVSPNFGLPAARKEIVPVLTTAEKEARRMKDDEKWMGSGFGTRHCVPGHLVHYILFQNKDPKNNSELLKRHPRLYVLFFYSKIHQELELMKQHEEISIRLQEEREKLAIQRQVDPGRSPVTLEDLTAGSPINHPFF